MPPGRKADPVPEEEPENEYERLRAQIMMRNNQQARALGIGSLTSLLRQSTKMRKAKRRHAEHNKNEEGLIDKVSEENNMSQHTIQSGGTRSKRVMASEEQVQPARMTRQRTKEQQQVQTREEGVLDLTINAEDDGSTQLDEQSDCNEGQENPFGGRCRGISMGKELDKLTRGLGTKIPVVIAEGNKRPEAPLQAAKFASEGGIILRQHIPVLTHGKEYKKDKAGDKEGDKEGDKKEDYLNDYIGKISISC